MWIYESGTGKLFHNGALVATGYSGLEECKNQPDLDCVKNRGPIPRGMWEISAPFDSAANGPYCLRLTPHAKTVTHGRGGFLIHGDSVRAPGTASHGCIILPRAIRVKVWESGDRVLEVVAGRVG